MAEPKEPECPPGRRPHRKRVSEVDLLLKEGKTGGICIDDTPEHRAWYLHEIAKYPRLQVVDMGEMTDGAYLIKVLKLPSTN